MEQKQIRIENNIIIGPSQQIYRYLIEEFHIKPEVPEKRTPTPTRYQLTPLDKQILQIRKSNKKIGEIFYTEEVCDANNPKHFSISLHHLIVQITD